jgi:hypothetical protein
VTFTHEGLRPDHECYAVCSNAWGEYISGSLRDLIQIGSGRPNSFEGEEALEAAQGLRVRLLPAGRDRGSPNHGSTVFSNLTRPHCW